MPGSGWSSPIVVGPQVVVTTAVPLDADGAEAAEGAEPFALSLRAMGLSADDGEVIWQQEVFRLPGGLLPRVHGKNSRASPTPCFDGERLIVHFGPGATAALDAQGNVLWKNDRIVFDARHGGGGSPIVCGDMVVLNCDGVENPFVVALDRRDGSERWRAARPAVEAQKFAFSTPLAIEAAGVAQIVSPGAGVACSYDPATGRELWRVSYPGKWSVIPRPAYAAGLIFVCTGYEGPADLLAIRPDGSGDVTATHVAWRTDRSAPHTPSVVPFEGLLYMVSDNGVASCLDAQTGEVHWRERLGGNFSASPLCGAGRVYFQDEEGRCTVVRAATEFERLARNDLEAPTLASFAATEGRLFIRTKNHLYCIASRGSGS